MRPGLKVALSLLITTVIFSLFFFLAYSGLFFYLETKFYSPRAKSEIVRNLERINRGIVNFHNGNIFEFSKELQEDYITRSFLTTQLREDIENRENFFYELKQKYPYLNFVRFIGTEGKRIHFSTLDTDTKQRTSTGVIYYNFNEVDQYSTVERIESENINIKIILDENKQSFIYSIPIIDEFDIKLGDALFYADIEGVKNYLINNIENVYGDIIVINDLGIIVDFNKDNIEKIKELIINIWKSEYNDDERLNSIDASENDEELILFSVFEQESGFIGLIVPEVEFEMKQYMKVILSASFFLTLFLIIFILFNIKKDHIAIFTHRIKRFQIQFLLEFIESKEEFGWKKLKRQLKVKSQIIKKQFKKSLGKYNQQYEDEINKLISKSWEEILNIIGAKEEKEEKVDLSKIEKILKEILRNTRYGVAPGKILKTTKKSPIKTPVKELDETVEEAETVEDLEDVEEIDLVEELEDVEDLEELDEAVEEAETVEDLEDMEELEEVEVLEEVSEETEAVEGLEEVEKPDEVVEELEPLEEIKTLSPEPYEELAELEETDSGKEAGKEEIKTLEIVEPTVMYDKIKEGIEELETVNEINALPPEPYEELEMLEEVVENEKYEEKKEDYKKNYKKYIEHFSIKELIDKVEEQNTTIIMEDGVYRIKDEVYLRSGSIKSKEIGLLSKAILGEWKSTVKVKDSIKIPVFEKRGLSLDYNYEKYKNKNKDLAQTKFLINISRMINAISMVILKKEENQYTMDISIGIDNESKEKLKFSEKDYLYSEYLIKKKFIVYNNDVSNNIELAEKFSKNDLKYFKSMVLFPSIFKNSESYILLGFSDRTDINLDNIIKKLKIV